jgi:uncharacterized membrane-anchored protein YhcB (DUF1043 family)
MIHHAVHMSSEFVASVNAAIDQQHHDEWLLWTLAIDVIVLVVGAFCGAVAMIVRNRKYKQL